MTLDIGCASVHVWREHYPSLALALELTLTALPAFTFACLKTCKTSRDQQQHKAVLSAA